MSRYNLGPGYKRIGKLVRRGRLGGEQWWDLLKGRDGDGPPQRLDEKFAEFEGEIVRITLHPVIVEEEG